MPREMSPEARQRLSQLAKQRHARGELKPVRGTPEGQRKAGAHAGGAKKARITKRVAEAAEEESNAKSIIEVFKDAIHPNQPMSIRLKGAEVWAKIAADHHKTEVAHQANEQVQHSREELIEILRGKLKEGPVAGIIRGQIEAESIIDAEVIDVEGADVSPDSAEAA